MDSYENGIAERRIADDTIDTSYMAVEVAKALEDAGVSGEDIDLILVATVTPIVRFQQ